MHLSFRLYSKVCHTLVILFNKAGSQKKRGRPSKLADDGLCERSLKNRFEKLDELVEDERTCILDCFSR